MSGAIVCSAIVVALGCTAPGTEVVGDDGGVASRGPLVVAQHSDPLSLDPHRRNEALTFSVLSNIYEALTVFDDQMRVGPSLAASWENPDEVTWRFHLRPGVTFHDGSPLTAADVVFSLKRAREHPASDFSSYVVEVAEVVAVDETTVDVITRRPYAILLNKLAFVLVVPADAPDEITSPVGTGPYAFVSYAPGGDLVLARHDGYWRDLASEERVIFRSVPDGAERSRQLIAGEADLVTELTTGEAERLAAFPDLSVVSEESLVVEFLQLSPVIDSPLTDVRVRRAIDLALDRQALVDAMASGQGRPLGQMVGRNVFGHLPGLEPTARDLATARQLLAEAGYPEGFEVELALRESRDAGPMVAQLAEAGIVATPVLYPWQDLYQRLTAAIVPFYYGGFLCPSADASDFFDSSAHTHDPERGYGQSNFGRYGNEELDELIEESGTTLNMIKRREILQRAMSLLMEEYAFLPLFAVYDLYGVGPAVEWSPRQDGWVLAYEIRRRPER